MKIKVKWKFEFIFLVICAPSIFGSFVQRHCSHVHPKPHDVSYYFIFSNNYIF